MSEQQLEFTVENAGERLDKVIVAQVGDSLSRAQIQTLIKDGQVTVNGAQEHATIVANEPETQQTQGAAFLSPHADRIRGERLS